MLINGGNPVTNQVDILLNLTGQDLLSGLDMMRFSLDQGFNWTDWEPFAATKSLILSGGDGEKEVHSQLRDQAGNVATFSDTIILDREGPTGSVGINGVAIMTNSANITLS